jgi:ADP-heptose:LPS heptosyltransferase
MIFFMPALEGLRRRWPQARIIWLSDREELVDELLPAAGLCDEIWFREWEDPPAERAAEIRRRVEGFGFDLVVMSLPSPVHDYQGAIRDIPVRVGHCRELGASVQGWMGRLRRGLVIGEFARRAVLNRPVWIRSAPEHGVARNLRLLTALGVPVFPELRPRLPIGEAHRRRAAELLEGQAPIGVHLGPPKSYNCRHWAPERYAELCAKLAACGAGPFALIGGPQEAESAARASRVFPGFISLVGRLSLLETFAAIERCRLFICSDTGPGKAAMALGVPTVTVWGPSDPLEAGAFWEPEKHLDLRTGIWCSPCVSMGMAKEGPGVLNYSNCGHHDCLQKLDSDRVFSAIRAKYPALFSA